MNFKTTTMYFSSIKLSLLFLLLIVSVTRTTNGNEIPDNNRNHKNFNNQASSNRDHHHSKEPFNAERNTLVRAHPHTLQPYHAATIVTNNINNNNNNNNKNYHHYTTIHNNQNNPCHDNHQCLNGGECIPLESKYQKVFLTNSSTSLIQQQQQQRQLSSSLYSNDDDSFTCKCPISYVGDFCQFSNPCYSTKCQNGGTCIVHQSANRYESPRFSCKCTIGYTASLCEIAQPSICLNSNPCLNGATCQLTTSVNDYKCICADGYRGENCQDIDHCKPNSCHHQGKCTSTEDSFYCNCTQGFTGETCLEDIDECALESDIDNQQQHDNAIITDLNLHSKSKDHHHKSSSSDNTSLALVDHGICGQHGRCFNTLGSFRCACEPSWTGPRCESRYIPCDPSPCLNGATCSQDLTTLTYRCTCPSGFNGTHCELNIDDCGSHQCQNGATCIDGINDYTCACPAQFNGTYCEGDVNECERRPNLCRNGATCHNRVGGYDCICVNGWTGHDCSENIDDCAAASCLNGATCIDRVGGFACECPPGKTGLLCHLEDGCYTRPYEKSPCSPNSTCDSSPVDGSPICTCPQGFAGADCSTDIDECRAGSPCEHGGSCVNTPGSFKCDCPVGFSGARCEININECDAHPCLHSGTCLDERGGYRCVCGRGYTGPQCEININECQSEPCQNNGTCKDLVAAFSCECIEGFTGERCELSYERNNFGTAKYTLTITPSFETEIEQTTQRLMKQLENETGTIVSKLNFRNFEHETNINSTELILLVENGDRCVKKCINTWEELDERVHKIVWSIQSVVKAELSLIQTEKEEKSDNPQTYQWFVLTLAVITLFSVIFLVASGNKQKVKAVTWFPEGFFQNNKCAGPRKDSTSKVGKIGVSTLQALKGNFCRQGGRADQRGARTVSGRGILKTNACGMTEMPQNSNNGGIYNEPYESYSDCMSQQYESYGNTENESMITNHHHNGPMTPPTMNINPVDIEGPNGMTALMVASTHGAPFARGKNEMIDLVTYGTTGEVKTGMIDGDPSNGIVEDLLNKGAQVNRPMETSGETALHMAARHRRADNARSLIECGADVNARDAQGRTPLHAAIGAEALGVFELLIRNRATNLNAQDDKGTTPLMMAAKILVDHLLEQLIKNECEINLPDNEGKTALHWAAATSNSFAVHELLANGANKDSQDRDGQTPLFLAAREGSKKSVEILLQHNANPDIADNMDSCPIDIAREGKHQDIERLLSEHVPNPHSLNNHQQTRQNMLSPTSPNTFNENSNGSSGQNYPQNHHPNHSHSHSSGGRQLHNKSNLARSNSTKPLNQENAHPTSQHCKSVMMIKTESEQDENHSMNQTILGRRATQSTSSSHQTMHLNASNTHCRSSSTANNGNFISKSTNNINPALTNKYHQHHHQSANILNNSNSNGNHHNNIPPPLPPPRNQLPPINTQFSYDYISYPQISSAPNSAALSPSLVSPLSTHYGISGSNHVMMPATPNSLTNSLSPVSSSMMSPPANSSMGLLNSPTKTTPPVSMHHQQSDQHSQSHLISPPSYEECVRITQHQMLGDSTGNNQHLQVHSTQSQPSYWTNNQEQQTHPNVGNLIDTSHTNNTNTLNNNNNNNRNNNTADPYNVPSFKHYMTPSPDSPFSMDSSVESPPGAYSDQQYQNHIMSFPQNNVNSLQEAGVFI